MLQIDDKNIEAEVYTETKNGTYFIKVHLIGEGIGSFYINSFTVRPSPRFPENGPWLQWPFTMFGRKKNNYIEFDGPSQLKDLIEDAIWRAIDVWNSNKPKAPDPSDDNKEINPNEIPY